jgi:hypothetical protein
MAVFFMRGNLFLFRFCVPFYCSLNHCLWCINGDGRVVVRCVAGWYESTAVKIVYDQSRELSCHPVIHHITSLNHHRPNEHGLKTKELKQEENRKI